MNEISQAVPEYTENIHQDADCSFIVQVHEPNEGNGAINRKELGCNASTPGGASYDSSHRNGAQKVSQFHAKPFYLRAICKAERDQWINDINTAVRTFQRVKADEMNLQNSAFHRQQFRLRSIYNSFAFQTATAFLVALNFFVTVRRHPVNSQFTATLYEQMVGSYLSHRWRKIRKTFPRASSMTQTRSSPLCLQRSCSSTWRRTCFGRLSRTHGTGLIWSVAVWLCFFPVLC